MTALFKACACGLVYATYEDWCKLPSIGPPDDYEGELLEQRNCPCGSTLGVVIAIAVAKRWEHTVVGPDVGGSPGSKVAPGAVMVWVDGQPITMTARGWTLLCSLADSQGRHVHGAEVLVARKLVASGLVRLNDDGNLCLDRGRVDGERWSAFLTPLGEVVAKARNAPKPACMCGSTTGATEKADDGLQRCIDCGCH